MKVLSAELLADIELIQQIPIVPTMLEVVCRSTGMGFAAIARVTNDKWVACSVRDEILFGLKPGGELPIETTICNEIRDSCKPVVIDDVDKDVIYNDHHTPALYGFKSYISMPIILKTGEFFGTLCAIDPKPALLSDTKTTGMFSMFAELISFHIQGLQLVERSKTEVYQLNYQLNDSINENRQFRYLSNHNLQEPLRKMRVFSGMLVTASEQNDKEKIKDYASRVDSCAETFSNIVKELATFSEANNVTNFELVDLDEIISGIQSDVSAGLKKDLSLTVENLPKISASPSQMKQLFSNLINTSIRFAKHDLTHEIRISAREIKKNPWPISDESGLVEIFVEDNGQGFTKRNLDMIFDIFPHFHNNQDGDSNNGTLAHCRKIVRNHGGSIAAESEPGRGTRFSVVLPVNG